MPAATIVVWEAPVKRFLSVGRLQSWRKVVPYWEELSWNSKDGDHMATNEVCKRAAGAILANPIKSRLRELS